MKGKKIDSFGGKWMERKEGYYSAMEKAPPERKICDGKGFFMKWVRLGDYSLYGACRCDVARKRSPIL